jgi:NAD-dependent DNA ligase
MTNFFARQGAAFRNDLSRSIGALVGIAQGLICDSHLSDSEVQFLNDWLNKNENIANVWPGDVLHARIRSVLADGQITETERDYLLEILRKLVGGRLEELGEAAHVSELMFDVVDSVHFEGCTFCLTGDFVFAPRAVCAEAIHRRGGNVSSSVTKKVNYVVVGGLGSAEWKHGSFGTKIEKAMDLRREGVQLMIVHEDPWANALSQAPTLR